MTTGHQTEDRGFKELFVSYPFETVEFFAPALIALHGRPAIVVALQQELPLPDLDDPSRFLDVALHCTWADGSKTVILLVEHWSEARKVDLLRVLWYYAALRLRHPGAEVLPVILVTDRTVQEVSGHLESVIAGTRILDFHVQIEHISPDDTPRLRRLQNRVALMLMALSLHGDPVDIAWTVLLAMSQAPGPWDDLRRFLPLLSKLAKMLDSDIPRLRQRLRQEPAMDNVLDEFVAEGRAEGRAEGQAATARAIIESFRHMVARGTLSVDVARSEITELIASHAIPEAMGREALGQLG